MQVALFATCMVDALSPATGRATVAVLERLGHEVVFPEAQTCCGQMHLNSGYPKDALRLARRFVEVFDPFDAIVVPSGSCAGTVVEGYRHLAEDFADSVLAERLPPLAARLHELSAFLVDVLGITDVGAVFPHRVAYHPSCHSLRVLGLSDQPRRLLAAVEGLELVGHEDPRTCCGFGGTFALKNASTSTAMLTDKLDALEASGAEYVCSVDTSCLAHIEGGAARRAEVPQPIHLAEILAQVGGDAAVHGPRSERSADALPLDRVKERDDEAER